VQVVCGARLRQSHEPSRVSLLLQLLSKVHIVTIMIIFGEKAVSTSVLVAQLAERQSHMIILQ